MDTEGEVATWVAAAVGISAAAVADTWEAVTSAVAGEATLGVVVSAEATLEAGDASGGIPEAAFLPAASEGEALPDRSAVRPVPFRREILAAPITASRRVPSRQGRLDRVLRFPGPSTISADRERAG